MAELAHDKLGGPRTFFTMQNTRGVRYMYIVVAQVTILLVWTPWSHTLYERMQMVVWCTLRLHTCSFTNVLRRIIRMAPQTVGMY